MIDVTSRWWPAILIAGICGMVGGLVYDLILDRMNDSGLLEGVKRFRGKKEGDRSYLDIGFVASVLVGAVAAVGFLYFMQPEVRTQVVKVAGEADVTTTFREYDPFRLIAASLIVGSGGVSFVKAMRAKLLKALNESRLEILANTADDIAESGHDQLRTAVADDAINTNTAATGVAGQLDALRALARNSRPS